ncbi:MAG TPA: hypothetical protein VK459_26825, partial [Polyangiaceae bacterium]|nr:hypothetical protein [Polyangiaceae bacterium]
MSARAATPREARLEYSRGPGAEHCPDEETLRSAVSTRLGYDPFRADAPRTITAAIARAGRSLNAVVKLLDASGNVTGKRDLTSTQNDCSELVGAMTLAISIAIDPQSELRGPASPAPPVPTAPEPPAEPPPAEPPPAEPPTPPSPRRRTPPVDPGPGEKTGANDGEGAPPPEPPRLQAHAGLSGFMTLGTSPGVSAGLAVVVGLRSGAASIGLEGRADLPTSREAVGGGLVTASLVLGTLTP